MKKLILLIFLCLVGYTIYLDLAKGTLQKLDDAPPSEDVSMPYESLAVTPGETVLSAMEKLNGTLPVSIDKAVNDFKKLNPETDPMEIKAGDTYKFPLYKR